MLQYIFTGLAGIALGIVAMRVWQSREAGLAAKADEATAPTFALPWAKVSQGRMLLAGAGVLLVAAIGIFVFRGQEAAEPIVASTNAPTGSQQDLADVDTMIGKLSARLEKEPNDGEGFRMLGWSYLMTGRPQQAIAPFKRAMELLPKQASVQSGYAEALVGVAGGKVTPEAKAGFDKALQLDPKEPRARYFSGLWLAQNGKGGEALDRWIDLANASPADAPWQPEVQAKIREVATREGVDVSGRLRVKAIPAAGTSAVAAGNVGAGTVPAPDPAKAAAVAQLPPDQQQASIGGMVDGLAARLKANPRDAKGWAMLVRSRMVLKQDKQAAADLASARKALAGDAAGLADVNAAAKDAGVPGA